VSNRLAGLQADSEVVKRQMEEREAAEREAYEAAKRARHEQHDLAFLLGEDAAADVTSKKRLEAALRNIAATKPTLTSDLLEDAKEDKRRIRNGDGVNDQYKDLKEKLDKMQLRSVDKAAQRRVYSMLMHPSADKDLIFVGDKEGNIGVWDPLASNDEEDKDAMASGYSWSLQVHGKAPITCLRFDPVSADSLFSSSYDSSIRMQSLTSGVSTEVWTGQEDVLISIFDILAPQSHPSAFTATPNPGLDERSMWIADHRGGLNHFDLRQPQLINTRRTGGGGGSKNKADTRRWQVCEKKIGGMAINPIFSSCISGASLDQHVRLFDVRNLQTLETTNQAPYSARNVDADVLDEAVNKAQISAHRAKLACTSVDWDPSGTKLVGVSYDDMLKIWDVQPSWLHTKSGPPSAAAKTVKKGRVKQEDINGRSLDLLKSDRPDDVLEKYTSIRHNNQTGKWLTLFRARFNANPTVESHFSIGSMDRRAEIWAADGTLLRTFYDADHVTAVPAVTCTHPRRVGRLATGNASGKCTFWAALDD
jgi:hypothetical protein